MMGCAGIFISMKKVRKGEERDAKARLVWHFGVERAVLRIFPCKKGVFGLIGAELFPSKYGVAASKCSSCTGQAAKGVAGHKPHRLDVETIVLPTQ
jgi:hypothetical protein